jgi:hypothetical protein
MISAIHVVSTIGCVDLPTVLLLLWGALATWFKELSSGLGGLDAYANNCDQIGHCLGLLHCDLLNSLNDLDVLDIQDSVPDITEMFQVVLEAFIMLLSDGLKGFSCRWTLIHTLEVFDEHGA